MRIAGAAICIGLGVGAVLVAAVNLDNIDGQPRALLAANARAGFVLIGVGARLGSRRAFQLGSRR